MKHTATTRRREVPLILLVEDHQDTRQMYAEFLGMGFEVMTAPDGEHALEAARLHRPDLVITDLSLPGIDGFELIEHVRLDPGLRAIPIICLSGYGGHGYEERAQAAGCDRILLKPCMPDKLAEVAAEVIQDAANRSAHS
jgi:two-component system cell cycle response regulator DivK